VSPADSAEAISNRAADELRTIAPDVEAGILYEKAGDALLEEAKRLDASLIVVGNRNMQGIKRVLGSVANTVSHNAPCDVYIVKTDNDQARIQTFGFLEKRIAGLFVEDARLHIGCDGPQLIGGAIGNRLGAIGRAHRDGIGAVLKRLGLR